MPEDPSNAEHNENEFAILFVDDEEQALKYFTKAFTKQFRTLTAPSVKQAQAILEQDARIAVVITDQRMPGETGVDLLRFVREKHPAIVRILTTAYADLEDAIAAVNSGEIFRYITKPWNLDTLQQDLLLAMRFFNLQRDRDLLIEEKLGIYQQLTGVNRARDLVIMASSLSDRLRYPLHAVNAFLNDAYLNDTSNPSSAPPATNVQALDLWGLQLSEIEQMSTIAQKITKEIGNDASAFNDKVVLSDRLASLGAGIETHLPKTELAPLVAQSDQMEKLFGILADQMGAESADNAITISVESIDSVWNSPGVEIRLESTHSSFLGAGQDTATTRADSLLAYLVAYHHGGALTVQQKEPVGMSITLKLPFDPI
ncbi:MAG: response regulator, partial [Proteobacteria bacterium]|nr:response regulator [Pseudomonadota bacterium]